MDLVHCQRCGMMPQFTPDTRGRYFMTSCSHLFCESCVRGVTDQCPQCQRNCSVMELNAQTGQEVKTMFDDPLNMLRTAMSKPLQVLQFQKQLNRNKMRIFGKMLDSLKSTRAENSNLKEENNRLRHINEEMTQNMSQLRMKVNELEMSAKKSPLPQMCAQGQGSDSLNLFRDPMDRPNAHVQPIVLPQHSRTPFSIARSPHSVISVTSSQSQQMFSRGPTAGINRVDLHPRSTNGSSPSSTPAFATPASSINGRFDSGLRSPFFRQPANNSSGFFGASRSLHTPGSTPSKTPELINRLRNLKCKSTPSGSLPSQRSY